MTSLKDLKLKTCYDSQEDDLAHELQVPLLRSAKYYDRGVGFFTSGWLRAVAKGIAVFASGGGKARIITSPKLEQSDWEAIARGSNEQKQASITCAVKATVDELKAMLEYRTLDALAWMVRDGLLEFRFAIPRGRLSCGDYHPKVAFFRDDECGWAVHGSMNDSQQAFRNVESVSVFFSEGVGSEYYHSHFRTFEKLWSGQASEVEVLSPTHEALAPFLAFTERTSRPYSTPYGSEVFTGVHLREYQKTAISAWEHNGRRGILEMATGTGKTFTSIQAAVRTRQQARRLALFVLVPYLHLIDQWAEDLEKFGFDPILCKGSANSWKASAEERRLLFNSGACEQICFVATHVTASNSSFRRLMKKTLCPKLLIADEVHGLGAKSYSKALEESFEWRLGLSATPQRWYDERGTKRLNDYFGGSVFEFGLGPAIENGHLVPYTYTPLLVNLEDDEMEEYARLSRDLAIAIANGDDDKAERIARARARLISGCSNVLPTFLTHLRRELQEADNELSHTLVYCAPGRHKEVLKAVSDMGLRSHDFVAETAPKVRQELLKRFATGELQVLVAVKCLDEGVDVPSTRTAYILASSSNPREFIQRRGRILRRSEGKSQAAVFDFLIGYWDPPPGGWVAAAQSLAKRCLPRFAEFASLSLEPFQARQTIFEPILNLNLAAQLDKRPWQIYKELRSQEPMFDCEEQDGQNS